MSLDRVAHEAEAYYPAVSQEVFERLRRHGQEPPWAVTVSVLQYPATCSPASASNWGATPGDSGGWNLPFSVKSV
jgi:hypothetical protein